VSRDSRFASIKRWLRGPPGVEGLVQGLYEQADASRRGLFMKRAQSELAACLRLCTIAAMHR